jgi:ribosomal protein S17E
MSNNKLLIEHIQELKPKLKINSIQTYITNLYKICRELKGKSKKDCNLGDLSFLNDFDKVMKTISDETLNTRKNRLIAIVVSLKAIDADKKLVEKYSEEMTKLAEESEERVKRQKLTDKQKENWVSYDELIKLTEKLFDDIKQQDILKKEKLTRGEYTTLQDYILLRTYLTFSWRNDFADMKVIKNEKEDDNKNNFLLVKKGIPDKFILNQYKTDSKYGKKTVKIPQSLAKVIKKFLKFNKSGYFLTLQDGIRPINSNGITKALNRLFQKHLGKTIGSSLLRHIIISHFRKNDPTIKEMEEKNREIEDRFMHSASMNDQYRKIE